MLFLTDENIYTQFVTAIRSLSHDVLDIKEQGLFGTSDEAIIQMAKETERILITADKDFSNILIYPPSQHSGIIVLRLSRLTIAGATERLVTFLQTIPEQRIRGKLIIVEPDRVRFRS